MTSYRLFAVTVLSAFTLTACQSEPPTAQEITSPPAQASAAVKYAWTQYEANGVGSARVIFAGVGVHCPQITVDSAPPTAMRARSIPQTYVGFVNDISVCEHPIATPAQLITIDNAGAPLILPALTRQTRQITVVGDTGCRLEGSSHQWCDGGSLDRGAWGFPQLSAAAAGTPSDMVLHVGDYLYRESTQAGSDRCDPYDPRRGWVHCGDYWKAWEADFFAPAQGAAGAGLLGSAPWIFVRGNHETCSRSWQGYFLFFAAGPAPDQCQAEHEVIDPYLVSLDGLDVYVVDTSNESAGSAQSSFTIVYNLLAKGTQRSWLATHVPTSDLTPAYANSQLVQRTELQWIHVGHVHYFHHLPATAVQQAQTITGGSGTKLDACGGIATCAVGASGTCCYGEQSQSDAGQYSYLTVAFDPQDHAWNATLRDVNGSAIYGFTVP